MKKQLTKSRIIGYLLLFTIASTGVLTATYARYGSWVDGEGTVTVAAWGTDVTLESLTIDVSDLTPGTTKAYPFQVTNAKDGRISQVAQEYSLTVESTENLPLEFTLFVESSTPEGSGTTIADPLETVPLNFQDGKAEMAGGSLPHTVSTTHKYTLSVAWRDDDSTKLADYADEIDLVTLTVKADQIVPTS